MHPLALGTFLRIWQINAMGYNTDEAVYSGQAAAIAGVPGLKDIFPVFRTHPLLVQFLLSIVYKIDFNDLAGRLLAVVAGMGTIYITYLIGKNLYSRLAGSLAALLICSHAISCHRQPPDAAGWTNGILCNFDTLYLVRFAKSQKREWLIATGACMGLTFLSKETSIVLLGAIFAFFALIAGN